MYTHNRDGVVTLVNYGTLQNAGVVRAAAAYFLVPRHNVPLTPLKTPRRRPPHRPPSPPPNNPNPYCDLHTTQIHPGIIRLMQGKEPADSTTTDEPEVEAMKGFTWESIISRYRRRHDGLFVLALIYFLLCSSPLHLSGCRCFQRPVPPINDCGR